MSKRTNNESDVSLEKYIHSYYTVSLKGLFGKTMSKNLVPICFVPPCIFEFIFIYQPVDNEHNPSWNRCIT